MVIRVFLLLVLLCGTARAESLRLVVPETHPVVGEMIPVTVRGEYTATITLEKLTFPDSDAYDWIQLARDRWRNESVDGRTVTVFERRLALFPRHAGPLTVGPLTHRLTVASAGGGREVLDVRSVPFRVEVAPFPAAGSPLAARSLKIEDDLSTQPGKLRDGETLVRRVTIKAEATLPHLLPVRPVIRQPWLISFTAPETRETTLTADGPETTIVWEWHLRPKTGEPGVLPPFEFAWFDTVARRIRKAEIPAIPFGYSSFSAGRTGVDRLPPSQISVGFGTFAAGLLTGFLLIFSAGARRRSPAILQTLKRWSPIDPTRRNVKVAARHHDLMALRSAVERFLARRRALGLPEVEGATGELDRAIYAEPSTSPPFDSTRFRRALFQMSPPS